MEDIEIIDIQPKHYPAFKALNKQWVDNFFKMEKTDYMSLDNPESYILNGGGAIPIALEDGDVSGVCALTKMEQPGHNELAKMAVAPAACGKQIGFKLGQAIIERTRDLGGTHIYLENNTVLEPAINLYRKLGFREVYGRYTPYERCNIQLEMEV